MPRRAVCPECGATTTVPDDSPDLQVNCARCGTPIPVPAGPPAAADESEDPGFDIIEDAGAPAAAVTSDRPPVGRRSRRDEDVDDAEDRPRRSRDDDEDDEDDDDRPRRSARRGDDDEDDDDDRPRRAAARSRDDDDEDEDDDRPRRRSRDDDEDDEDDRPRRAAARGRDDDEDEDDEDDDRPKGRRSRDDDEDEDEDDEEMDEETRAMMEDLKKIDPNDKEAVKKVLEKHMGRPEDWFEEKDLKKLRKELGGAVSQAMGLSRADEDEDDEDEDEERGPKKKFKPAVGGWDDEDDEGDDEDDEDDRPRRGKAGSKSPLLLILGLLAFLVVGAGGGAVAYFLFWDEDDPGVVLNDGSPDGRGPNDNGITQPRIDPRPKDTQPKDTKPKDTKPVDPKPKDTRPIDTKPKDTKPKDPVDSKPVDAKPQDPKEMEPPKKTPPPAADLRLVHPVAARLPITPAAVTDPRTDVPLPGPVRDVCVGGGGRFLIFHCPTARKLAVFDVSAGKVARTITVTTDDVLFAASMEKLAVIYPDEKAIIRYSLASFRPETDTILDVRQRPTAAAMGSATAGPLILGGIPAQQNASKMSLAFLDLDTLAEVPIAKAEGVFAVSFGSAAHLRVSADGRTVGAWFANLRPSGLQVARLDGNTIRGSHLDRTVGHVTPGPDGQTIFTEEGQFSADAKPLGRKEPAVPAVHGGGFLTVSDIPPAERGKLPTGAKRVSVWQPGRDAPVANFDGLPGFDGPRDAFERNVAPLALDKRLFLVPEAGILVVVPPAADKLHLYKLDAGKGEPKKGGG